jgi:hypothetical protein
MATPHYDSRTQPLNPAPLAAVGEPQREYVARVLCEAFAADRLSVEQLDERLTSLYQATTAQQLGHLLADPHDAAGSLAHAPPPSRIARASAIPERGVGAAIMGGYERGAGWVLPRHFKAIAVMGGVELDLRDAKIAPGVSEIEAYAFMGGVVVLVPDGVRVEAVGMAVMGGFSVKSGNDNADDPDVPLIRISGFAFMGGVDVKRKDTARMHQKRYEQALRRADTLAKTHRS